MHSCSSIFALNPKTQISTTHNRRRLSSINTNGDTTILRQAGKDDVPHIVALLADDKLGQQREKYQIPLPDCYIDAFNEICSSNDNELIVMCDNNNNNIIGCMQITFIPYLTFQGGKRCLIEGVRISSKHRGQGLGEKMFEYAINKAKEMNCHMVQLTTNKGRPDAHNFYQKLGFKATHEGFKLYL